MNRSRIARALAVAAAVSGAYTAHAVTSAPAATSPIQHVVVVVLENHSFDNVLGYQCATEARAEPCDGTVGPAVFANGTSVRLRTAADVVAQVGHATADQRLALAGKWGAIPGCGTITHHACVTQYQPGQIPNVAALARTYGVADRFFEMDSVPSFGGHVDLAAATLDGFTGDNPPVGANHGWGCDTTKTAPWRRAPGAPVRKVPTCVPDYTLDPAAYPHGGASAATPVAHVPTIMDRLQTAGLPWRLYVDSYGQSGYQWAICPTFASCIDTSEAANVAPSDQIIDDATAGNLPAFSFVAPDSPTGLTSEHNGTSMAAGDDWLGRIAGAIVGGPEWSSTALFVTWDDCGCFYDHVPPPPGLGIRLPLLIVSPYVAAGTTTHSVGTFASFLAFAEHQFGLAPLNANDAGANDLADAFNFGTFNGARFRPVPTGPTPAARRYLATRPTTDDDT